MCIYSVLQRACVFRGKRKKEHKRNVEKKESPWTRSNHYVMLFYKIGRILLSKLNAKMKFFKMNFHLNEFHFH